MGYLLDTHTAIWALENSPNLSKNAKDVMAQSANVLYISIVSAWEIAIKVSIGKLSFGQYQQVKFSWRFSQFSV